MNNDFNALLKQRRSQYHLSNEQLISEDALIDIVESALLHTPTPFNIQSSRVLLLLNEDHDKLWDLVIAKIAENISGKALEASQLKIAGFKNTVGTILYFEEQALIDGLQTSYPAYAANFPIWASQANGMLQNNIWLGLSNAGYGASLQHYNELISGAIKEMYNLPTSYQLVAQMPFGKIVNQPDEKVYVPIEERLFIKK